MTTTTTELSEARTALEETDDVTAIEHVLRDLEISVAETTEGPRASVEVEGEDVPMSELAVKTLATKLEVPQNYVLKCPAELQASNLLYWLKRSSDRKRVGLIIGSEKVQTFASPKFIPVKNVPLFDAVVEKIGDGDESKVKLDHFEHDFASTRIAMCHEGASHKVDNSHWIEAHPGEEAGDIVRAGVNVMNSLTGLSHVEINPFCFRLFCSNGMVTPTFPSGGPHYRYDPKSSDPPVEWLAQAVDSIGKNFEDLFKKLDETANTNLFDVQDALAAEAQHVPGRLREQVMEAFDEEPFPTVWGVINAVTRAANDAESPPSHRLQAQRHAGNLAINAICEQCKRPLSTNGH